MHKNWMGTDRVTTDLNGATGATYTSLPFGDGGSENVSESYAGWDFEHYGEMDVDYWDSTYHAQFRNYSELQARWLSPDPYDGSYDASNPQSFNRYAYVLNNPMSDIDPDGEDTSGPGLCYLTGSNCGSGGGGGGVGGGGTGIGQLQMYYNWYMNTYMPVSGVAPGVAADSPPPGYVRSGTNTSDGNPIYVDAAGNTWIGSAGSPGLSYSGYLMGLFVLNTSKSAGLFNGNGSSEVPAPNNANQSSWQQKMRQVSHYMCGKSPGDRVAKSVLTGAGFGAVTGGIGGFVAGEVFGGEVTLGATGFVGAYLGAHVGAAVGAANGLATGTVLAGICSAGFQYDN